MEVGGLRVEVEAEVMVRIVETVEGVGGLSPDRAKVPRGRGIVEVGGFIEEGREEDKWVDFGVADVEGG